MFKRRLQGLATHCLMSALLACACLSVAAGTAWAQGENVTTATVQPSPAPSMPSAEEKKPQPPRYVELGKSVKGTPIMAAIYGSGERSPVSQGSF